MENGKLTMDIEIPVNTSASIFVPAAAASNILENGKPLPGVSDIKVLGTEGGYIILSAGSGKYHFVTGDQ